MRQAVPVNQQVGWLPRHFPLSVGSSERCFSTIRKIKNWLRAFLGLILRLIGFVLLNSHKNIDVDVEAVIVIDKFFKIFREQNGICTITQKEKKKREKKKYL